MWLIFALCSAVFASASTLLAKRGLGGVDSDLATAVRTCVVLVFAWLMVFIQGLQGELTSLTGGNLLFLALSGAATGVSWLCYFRALRLAPASKVAPVDKSSAVITILLAAVILGENVTWLNWIGMALISCGTILMCGRANGEAQSRLWLVYALLSALFAAVTSILAKLGLQGISGTTATALRTIVVLIFAWCIAVARKKQRVKDITRRDWLFLTLSGAATGASWLCYYNALKLGSAGPVAAVDKLSVIFTVIFAWLCLREKITKRAWIGLVLLAAGTAALIL